MKLWSMVPFLPPPILDLSPCHPGFLLLYCCGAFWIPGDEEAGQGHGAGTVLSSHLLRSMLDEAGLLLCHEQAAGGTGGPKRSSVSCCLSQGCWEPWGW